MQIVARPHWGANARRGPDMRLPAREVWLHHSVTTVSSNPIADMRAIERVGVQRFGRFSYSYAVHPHGTVLEGAGTTVGAHTAGRNSSSFGIVLIGNYDVQTPTHDQLAAVAGLIRWLIDTGKLIRGASVGGHRDVKSTACPGGNAYSRLPEIRALVTAPHHTKTEDDDMPLDANDRKFISDTVRDNISRAVQFVAAGQQNALFSANVPWMGRAVTLPRLAAIAAAGDDVDEAELARQILTILPPDAIAAAIPDEKVQPVAEGLAARLAD
jgi:N-acetylmuramoyl-L-alanine amidase